PLKRVGGPYIDMAGPPSDKPEHASMVRGPWGAVDQRALDAFDYWLAHKRGADFVVVDGHATEEYGAADEFEALEKLSAVSRWVRARTELPLGWAGGDVEPVEANWSYQHQVADCAAGMVEIANSG